MLRRGSVHLQRLTQRGTTLGDAMRLTTKTIKVTDETADMLREYCDRRGITSTAAVGLLVRTALLRLATLRRYRETPAGRRANRRRR